MTDAGLNCRQMNRFLTTLEVPPIHHKTVKRYERELSGSIHEVAAKSCAQALEGESDG